MLVLVSHLRLHSKSTTTTTISRTTRTLIIPSLMLQRTLESWGNGLKVCYIDDAADQIVGIATTSLGIGAEVGFGVTASLSGVVIPGTGTTSEFTGFLKGIITGLTTDSSGNSSTIDIKVVSRVETVGTGSTETKIDYKRRNILRAFGTGTALNIVNNSGVNTTGRLSAALTPATAIDWYDQQTLGLTNSTTFWKSIAPRPTSNVYVTDRQGKNDGLHIAVVDDDGSITGIKGNILEKHVNLSKAGDAVSNVKFT